MSSITVPESRDGHSLWDIAAARQVRSRRDATTAAARGSVTPPSILARDNRFTIRFANGKVQSRQE